MMRSMILCDSDYDDDDDDAVIVISILSTIWTKVMDHSL